MKDTLKKENTIIDEAISQDYKYGFVTDIEQDTIPPGLNEDVIRVISAKKGEPDWLKDWRLKAYKNWKKMKNPSWANITYPSIDYQSISYYSAPKEKKELKSLDEVDPELLETYNKLGIPLQEQKMLAGVAVDAVFDSVSVVTTFKKDLEKHGIIFCPFSEAVLNHPNLVRKYLGSVVPMTDNFFAALNSAVFSDGSFVYIPKGVRCPMELSTYFRINAANTGQFERTLIIADEGSYVSYLEGCTAPMRDENQLHAAVVELIAHKDAEIISRIATKWGWNMMRGSSKEKGKVAYKDMIRALKQPGKVVFITPDGPTGPARIPKPGGIRAAQTINAAIIPISVHSTRRWGFTNWDTFYLEQPFGKIFIQYGEPVFFDKEHDFNECSQILIEKMDEVEQINLHYANNESF